MHFAIFVVFQIRSAHGLSAVSVLVFDFFAVAQSVLAACRYDVLFRANGLIFLVLGSVAFGLSEVPVLEILNPLGNSTFRFLILLYLFLYLSERSAFVFLQSLN